MIRSLLRTSLVLAGVSLFQTIAVAHATFENPDAVVGKTYKGTLRVPHGCQGSSTHTVKMTLPEGFYAVKPMPKAGWTLTTTKGAYAKSYESHGKAVSEGVKEIIWSGGLLPDEQFDDFSFIGSVSSDLADKTVYIPVVQICERGDQRWVEIPTVGQDAHSLKAPAPHVRVLAQQGGHHHGGHEGHMMAQATPTPVGTETAGAKAGTLAVEQPWTRATPPGAKVAGGFMTIRNAGTVSDRLIGAKSDIAGIIEIHEMTMDAGVMKMRALPNGLEILANGSAELKPGGYHVMFLDLKQPLKEGEKIKGALIFEKAGAVDVEFSVQGMGSRAPAGEHKHIH